MATRTSGRTGTWPFSATPDLDVAALAAEATQELGTDEVDLVDLSRASAVLRRDAATHGRVLVETEPGAYENFRLEALTFWCDAEPVLRRAHADVLRAAAGPG